MIKRAISEAMLALLVIVMLTLASNTPLISACSKIMMGSNDCRTVGEVQTLSSDLHENIRGHRLSIHAYEWDFNRINEWADFAKVDSDSIEIVIGISDSKSKSYDEIKRLIADNQGELLDTVSIRDKPIAVVADIPRSMAASFAQKVVDIRLSRYIEPNLRFQLLFTPDDPDWDKQWGPKKIEADYAWDTTMGGPSVLLAVIDTGIYYNHPDLRTNYVAKGRDWVNDDDNPLDDVGHGTHCAGIVAATINNSIGIAGLAQVQLMAEKGLGPEGGYSTDLANAIIHAVDQGADILSNSWGGYVYSSLIHEAVQYAYNHGVLVIGGAGNEATSQEIFPAGYDEVIAVSATTKYDTKASFTNFGEWVELAAPGVDIYSTFGPGAYLSMDGTSMACPHVAGVAALAWSHFQGKTRDWLRLWLQYTADDLGDSGFDEYYGYGRINARKAVEESQPDHDVLIISWEKPAYVEPGNPAVVSTEVLNFGAENESNVIVQLLVNGTVRNSTTIDSLDSGESVTVSCSWTPTSEGVYNFTSRVVSVSGETRIENNAISGPVFVGIKTIRVPTHLPTIQEAINTADAGFTILVGNGTYAENVVIDKPLSLIGENRDNTTIRGTGRGMVLHVLADNVNVTGFTIEHSGIEEEYYSGILLDEISNCSVYDNNLTDNAIGIFLWQCSVCFISGNNFTDNNDYGVLLHNSTMCSISGNTLKNNAIGVLLNCSSGCSVFNNEVENSEAGLALNCSLHCSVFINHAKNNGVGIELDNSSNCSIQCNTVVENDYGIKLTQSADNRIIHNIFVNNTFAQAVVNMYCNVWDDDYPGGGNYWSDYNGTDLYSGPYQNETGSDGIGDTPYIINVDNKDRYPLIDLSSPVHDVAITDIIPLRTVVGQNCSLNVNVIVTNQGCAIETFNVTAYANTTQIGKQTVTSLNVCANKILSFTWDSTGFAIGNYTISAVADVVTNETDTLDNTYIDGIVTVRLPVHDIGVVDVAPVSNVVPRGFGLDISVTIENPGDFVETSNVTAYANETTIEEQEVSLNPGESVILVFSWNTTGFSSANYTIKASVTQVPEETHTDDNTYINGVVTVTLPGDVAVVDVTPSKTVVEQGYSIFVNVTVENQGDFTVTFNVSVFYDETALTLPDGKNHTKITLTSGNYTTLTIPWDTTATAKGTYTITAKATLIPGETDTVDNNFTDGWVAVTIPGDINGDFIVDIVDLVKVIKHYGSHPGHPDWNPNADVNCDGLVDIQDLVLVIKYFGTSIP